MPAERLRHKEFLSARQRLTSGRSTEMASGHFQTWKEVGLGAPRHIADVWGEARRWDSSR